MKKQWNILAGDNRGSGIIVVLISMVCVGLMGASLMFMSYTAIRLKATERQASKDFYSAETAMDEIRAGVQSAVSEAIATSYKYALETYSGGTDIEERFEERFLLDLQNTGLLESGGNNYKVATLKKYVSNPADETVTNSPGVRVTSTVPSGSYSVTKEAATNTLVLNGVEVEYTAPNGYTTKISTDLSIGMPKFVYTTTATSFAGLPQHALIAKTALDHTSGNNAKITITGSAYAGSMNLTASNSQLAIKNGTLVCAGDVAVSGAGPTTVPAGDKFGRLVTDDTVKFWAERIEVNGGSSVNLNGETRVLDDLELAGAKAEATLSGIYYGFGDGLVNPAKDYIIDEHDRTIPVEPSKRSSAILVNGLNSKLDLSGLKQLILAGRAYISDSLYSVPPSGSKNAVPTVESISVRSNQQMYLVDPRYLEVDKADRGTYVSVTANPIVINDEEGFVNIDELIELGSDRIRLKARDEDGNAITIRGGRLTYRTYTLNGLSVIYCYMRFEDPSAENEYFEKYFKEHADNMSRYLVDGEVLSDLNPTSGTIYSLGYTIQNDQNKEGAYAVSRPSGKIDSTGMRSTYNQLKTTLVDANTEPNADNPYNYIVNETKLNQLGSTEVREFTCTWIDNGARKTAKGIATRGAYAVDEYTDSSMRLIIAAGDVTVTKNYNGLIICGGTIRILNTVDMSAKPDDVMHVFDAVDSTGTALREYLREGITGSDGASSSGDGWKLNSLVTYKNWTKS